MHWKAQSFFSKVGFVLSGFLSAAGFIGLLIVIQMGLLPSNNPMGHSEEYQQGWALFFLLLLGIPCLLAFFGGLTPLILWFMRSRNKSRKTACH